jgi:hypothetical protein
LKGGYRVDHLLVEFPTRRWINRTKKPLFIHYLMMLREVGYILAPNKLP